MPSYPSDRWRACSVTTARRLSRKPADSFRRFLSPRLVDEAKQQVDRGIAGRMEGHAEMHMEVTEGSVWWPKVSLTSHPLWARLWGPIIGPVIAVLSFVCSVGNIPLAAVLWNGGISFGGVIAFIFADLIVLPILDICRKYYGARMMAFVLATFYVSMAFAALVVEFAWCRREAARASPSFRLHSITRRSSTSSFSRSRQRSFGASCGRAVLKCYA
jgi:hypothetical protein